MGITFSDFQRIVAGISPSTIGDAEGILRKARQINTGRGGQDSQGVRRWRATPMTMCLSYARIGQREDAIIRSCMLISSAAASTRRPT